MSRVYCERVNLDDILKDSDRGLYAFTNDELYVTDAPNKKYKVKIGLAGGQRSQEGGICKRMYSYHTCFPDGVYILALLKVKAKTGVGNAEKALKEKLKEKGLLYRTSTRKEGEWYKTTIKQLDKAFKEVYKENRSLMDDEPELFEKRKKAHFEEL